MAISLYCAATHIRFTEGAAAGKRIRIQAYGSYPLQEGAIINGMITDEDALITALKEMAAKKLLPNKPVSLVVDSSNIMLRTITAPILQKSAMMHFVHKELSMYQEEGQSELLVDYAVLKPSLPGGGGQILAVGIERPFLETYETVFRAAGFRLASIDVGLHAQIKLAGHIESLQSETFVFAQVDGNNLVLTLFEAGQYVLANRYRLLHHFGSDGWLSEFTDNLSSLIQFSKGQKHKDISTVYVDGIVSDGMRMIEKGLARFQVAVLPMPKENVITLSGAAAQREKEEPFSLGAYMYTVGNLLRK